MIIIRRGWKGSPTRGNTRIIIKMIIIEKTNEETSLFPETTSPASSAARQATSNPTADPTRALKRTLRARAVEMATNGATEKRFEHQKSVHRRLPQQTIIEKPTMRQGMSIGGPT